MMGHVALVFNAILPLAVERQLPHGGEVQEGRLRGVLYRRC